MFLYAFIGHSYEIFSIRMLMLDRYSFMSIDLTRVLIFVALYTRNHHRNNQIINLPDKCFRCSPKICSVNCFYAGSDRLKLRV